MQSPRLNSVKALLACALIAGGVGAASAASTSTSIFLKLEKNGGPIEGESTDSTHAKQIDVSDFSWEVDAESSFLRGTGAAVGKPVPGKIAFTKTLDKASSEIMKSELTGTSFDKATIEFTKTVNTGSSPKPFVYLKIELGSVFVTKYAIANAAGNDERPEEDVEVVFKTYKQTYTPMKADGTADKPVILEWNFSTMTGNVGSKDSGEPSVGEAPVASGTTVSVQKKP